MFGVFPVFGFSFSHFLLFARQVPAGRHYDCSRGGLWKQRSDDDSHFAFGHHPSARESLLRFCYRRLFFILVVFVFMIVLFCVGLNYSDLDMGAFKNRAMPEVVLVKKAYLNRKRNKRGRHWKLASLEMVPFGLFLSLILIILCFCVCRKRRIRLAMLRQRASERRKSL